MFQGGPEFLEDSEEVPLPWAAKSQLGLIAEVGGPIEDLHVMSMQNTMTL